MLRFFCLLVGFFVLGDAHKTKVGMCPKYDGLVPFTIDRFVGQWYVVRQTEAVDPCLQYSLSIVKPGKVRAFVKSYNSPNTLKFNKAKKLKYKDENPSEMRLKTNSIISKGEHFTVLMTDYESYAAVFLCDGYGAFHRESLEIWSRQPVLHPTTLQLVHGGLHAKGLDLADVENVDQITCRAS